LLIRQFIVALWMLVPAAAIAQQPLWVQIEAQPNLTEAQARARSYAADLASVSGFSLGSGWYAIVLGPYSDADANATLVQLRAQGRIPRDSFIADGAAFRQRFWPIGAGAQAAPVPAPAPQSTQAEPGAEAPVAANLPNTTLPDESPRQARASEAALTAPEREELQRALEWEGFYTAAIDGDFGAGTRRAMGDYQQAKGYDVTGILTTKQRTALMTDYSSILAELGMQTVVDNKAGISLRMPAAMVSFSGYDYPFAHYQGAGTADNAPQVILISQQGSEATLTGLYDVMQTLQVVPREGFREKNRNNFTLTGQNDVISSYTYAERRGGIIKGFTLVWPSGDDKRMSRVIGEMRTSFTVLPGAVLDETQRQPGDDQAIDLVAGLELRAPRMTRSGFFVDTSGTVVTTADAVKECSQITVGDGEALKLVAADEARGWAILQPLAPLAPPGIAIFKDAVPRLKSDIAVSGFSYGGILGAPTLTFGKLADIRGLNGEAELSRLAVNVLPEDAGGPVLSADGTVLGMLLTRSPQGGRQLPDEVSFALNADALNAALKDAGVSMQRARRNGPLEPEDLTDLADKMTVLVSCWP